MIQNLHRRRFDQMKRRASREIIKIAKLCAIEENYCLRQTKHKSQLSSPPLDCHGIFFLVLVRFDE